MFAYGMLLQMIGAFVLGPAYLFVAMISVFTGICTLCFIGMLSKQRNLLDSIRVLVPICALFVGMGLAILFHLWSQTELAISSLGLFAAGSILVSIGSAGSFFFWGAVFADVGSRTVLIEVGMGFFIALLLLAPFSALPKTAQVLLILAACLLDAFLLLFAHKKTKAEKEDQKLEKTDARWIRRKMYTGMICYGVAMGLSSSLLQHTGQAIYFDTSIIRMICGFIVFLIAVLIVIFAKKEPILLLYRIAYLIIALSIVSLLLLFENGTVLTAVLFVGHLLILTICMFLLFRTGHRLPLDRAGIVAFGVAAFLMGDLVARGTHDLLISTKLVPADLVTSIFTLLLVTAALLAYAVFFSERDIEKIEKLLKKADSLTRTQTGALVEAFCDGYADIASKQYGLTPREKEILSLLIIGRSSPRIQSELFISESTVHTHIRHIYTKMSVHSRQEVIDRAREWHEAM